MKLQALLDTIEYSLAQGRPGQIRHITYDSRQAGEESLFVCLVGANADGHDYVRGAYDRGCRSFLCQRAVDLPADACVVITADTRSALAELAAVFYGEPAKKLKLIGITGTKGKTTTALLLQSVLENSGRPCGYIGSNGILVAGKWRATANTTPESLPLQGALADMVAAGCQYAVLEVSSQALQHNRVQGLQFDTAVFTNLSEDHIGVGEHASFEEYRAAKRLLFTEHCAGAVVYNADDPASELMCAGLTCRRISCGVDTQADYRARELTPYRSHEALGISFRCDCPGGSVAVGLCMPGDFSVQNGLIAMAVCGRYGVQPEQAARILENTTVAGRFEMVPAKKGCTFVIDYAHNGLSLRSALQVLRSYGPRRLICLFGSVGGRTQMRRRELAEAASALADLCILTSDNPDYEEPEQIIRQMLQYFDKTTAYLVEPDREKAILKAYDMAQPGDIILLAGKGHENYQLIRGVKQPFSERSILLSAGGAQKDHKEETICI